MKAKVRITKIITKIKIELVFMMAVSSIGLLVIAGCSYLDKKGAENLNPPSQRQQRCSNLQNQLAFDQSNFGTSNTTNVSASQEAEIVRLYDKYDCKKFEQK